MTTVRRQIGYPVNELRYDYGSAPDYLLTPEAAEDRAYLRHCVMAEAQRPSKDRAAERMWRRHSEWPNCQGDCGQGDRPCVEMACTAGDEPRGPPFKLALAAVVLVLFVVFVILALPLRFFAHWF